MKRMAVVTFTVGMLLLAGGLTLAAHVSAAAPHPLVVPPPLNVHTTGWTPCGGHYCLNVGWTNPVDAGIVHVVLSVYYWGASSGPAACIFGNLGGSDTFAWATGSGASYVGASTVSLGTTNYAYSAALKLTDGSGTSAATACIQLPETYFLLVPSAPTMLTATAGATGTVHLNWTKNATGAPLVGGNVTEFANSTTCAGPSTNVSVASAAVSKNITGLTVGEDYAFSVAESNATGRGFNSTCVSFTPAAPIVGGLGALPDNGALLLWTLLIVVLMFVIVVVYAKRR